MSSTPRRSFGIDESALGINNDTPGSLITGGEQRRILGLGRISFNQIQHKPSLTSRWRSRDEEDGIPPASPGRPPIPSALEPKGESYSTPLPALSMIVLSIVRTLTSLVGGFTDASLCEDYAWRISDSQCFDSVYVVHGEGYVIVTKYLLEVQHSICRIW